MASSSTPYYVHDDPRDDESILDDGVIEADEAIEADDPLHETDRTPLRGNIEPDSSTSRGGNGTSGISGGYLTSRIPGEDRRAPQNTIDESVWQTLSRDLLAVWEKMRQVLYPKYLVGGRDERGAKRLGFMGPAYFLPAADSFFQSICIIGYTLFPLVIAALLSAFGLPTIVRIPVYLVLIAWSLAAGLSKQRECPALCKKTTRALKLQIIEKHARIPPGQGD
ncbi:hypothetical protein AN5926.2 [Aspergillus nidulans FGSC A4]|nr:hypothetical protein AN5926.2 [Aspergillus nidulans FGSC A4]|eukprot:XP_663530.1 hypothetical protein AN5926.2 [Aspergillus nidulans FGSC A4]